MADVNEPRGMGWLRDHPDIRDHTDSNEDERQKLLGQKFVLVVIDEAQAFTIDLRQVSTGS